MSAFMVNNRTLAKISLYMARCANCVFSRDKGISPIKLGDDFRKLLLDEGLATSDGVCTAPLIFQYLYEKNRKALVDMYGKKSTDEEMCPECTGRMPNGIACDTREETRREWLANLYTVVRCYIYQITEGGYQEDEFYRKMVSWRNSLAAALADYVVKEVRPFRPMGSGERSKTWDEF